MLAKVIEASDRSRFEHAVIGLGPEGPVAARLRQIGVRVSCLAISRRNLFPSLFHFQKLGTLADPHIIAGWMYHGNLAASLLSTVLPSRPPVLWGIRQTLYDLSREKRGTAATIRLGAVLSRRAPKKIIYNSTVAATQHAQIGYDTTRGLVIPNGFDLDRFAPSEDLYRKLRKDLGLRDGTLVIGMVARFHAMKRHDVFLSAIPSIIRDYPQTHFLMAGAGITPDNETLMRIVNMHGVAQSVSLLGERSDVEQILPGLDILCMPSGWGEGFPNVIGEAMSCEVPCVVTDVGDAAKVLGPAGIVVAPGSAEELARGAKTLLSRGAGARRILGELGRERASEQFDLNSVARRFENVFQTYASQRESF